MYFLMERFWRMFVELFNFSSFSYYTAELKRTKTTINQEEEYVRKFYRRTDYDELLPIWN